MWKKMFYLIIGFSCGYLFIKWFPIMFPIQLNEILLEFVLNPFEFLAASFVFIVGFIINAHLLLHILEQGALLIMKQKLNLAESFLTVMLLLSFIILFKAGFWQTFFFFGFSVLYGIISLDFKRFKAIGN